MATTSTSATSDDVAALRSEIESLRALVAATPSRERSWRRPLALVSAAILVVGMVAGVAGANGTTTDVTFVPLSPAKAVLNNASILAHKSTSPVVIGGTTTVPSNATAIQVVVSAKGAASGYINIYPALNPGAGIQSFGYPSGNVATTDTINVNVGQSGELTFYNGGSGTSVVTAKITGYSTQVTAGDINGVGGTAGQVLTNDGVGGAAWQTPGQAYTSSAGDQPLAFDAPTLVDPVNVPAGSYHVIATFDAHAPTPDFADCWLRLPNGAVSQTAFGAIDTSFHGTYYGSGTVQMLATTSAGAITLYCESSLSSNVVVQNDAVVATQVGSATGTVVH
ncbi:MAG: hypothetical protein ACTHJM_15075 [Marmoricola sp.]